MSKCPTNLELGRETLVGRSQVAVGSVPHPVLPGSSDESLQEACGQTTEPHLLQNWTSSAAFLK